jgi:copper chaperone CopZ
MFAGLGVSVAPIASVFDAVRPHMLVLGGAASAAAMYLAFRPARLTAEDCGCGPARPNWFGRSMALATVFAVVTAAAFPQLVAAYSRASREPAPVVDESPGVQRIEFPIRGMTCAGCAAGVEDALQRLREVSRARVSYERRSAVVWLIPGVEDSFTLEAKIADTIERAGFKAQIAHPSGQ